MAIKVGKKDKTYAVEWQGAYFVGAPLTTSRRKKIMQRHSQIKKGIEVTDHIAALKERFVKSIESWEGVIDEDDKGKIIPVECNDATKSAFVETNFDDAREVLDKLDDTQTEESRVETDNLGK